MSTKITPQSDSNLDVTVTESDNLVSLDIQPASFIITGAGLGTVTQVITGTGLTGGPITTSGTVAIDSTVATLDGAQALTNKTGLISQWTNDAGYITSETDNQTLSFTTPDLTISNGNTVDLTALKTTSLAFSALTATPTTISGYGITDAFDGVYSSLTGKPTLFSGAYADLSGKPTIPTNNNQLTNGAGYTTNTGTVTPTSTDTFTNKSGAISQWTNDAGYLTSETDNQTLSFANPNLSISSGNSVDLSALTPTSLAWSAITSTPTTVAGYGITDAFDGVYSSLTGKPTLFDGAYSSLTGTPTIPTQTVINNNGDNRLVTGSATADNLNGESDFTWDGTNALISGTASSLTAPVLKLEGSTSNWNAPQLMCSDSNGNVFSQVGRHNTGGSNFQWNITLDPDNDQPRTNVGGNGNTYAGDYFVAFEKNYADTDEITMDMRVFGAHDGFNITVNDDNNGGVDSYNRRPMSINAKQLRVYTDDTGSTRSLDVYNGGIKFFNAYTFPTTDGSANQVLQTDGAGNITFQTVSGGGTASTTPTLTGDASGYQGIDYVVTVTNYGTAYVPGSQFRLEITKDSDSSVVSTPQDFTDNSDGTFTVSIPSNANGAHTVRVKAQNFAQAESAEATMSLTLAPLNITARYWRIKDFDGGSGPAATNTSIMVANFRMYDTAGQTGTAYPSNMTSHNTPTPFAVSSQGAYSSAYDDWKAFDSDPTNTFYWNLGGNMSISYLAIDLGSAQSIKSWSFKSGNGAAYAGPFTIYYATQADFSDEVKLKSLEFTTNAQVVNFG